MSNENLLDVVRVKTPTGVERNATRVEARRTGAQIIDKPTHAPDGRPVPAVKATKPAPAPKQAAPTPTPPAVKPAGTKTKEA